MKTNEDSEAAHTPRKVEKKLVGTNPVPAGSGKNISNAVVNNRKTRFFRLFII